MKWNEIKYICLCLTSKWTNYLWCASDLGSCEIEKLENNGNVCEKNLYGMKKRMKEISSFIYLVFHHSPHIVSYLFKRKWNCLYIYFVTCEEWGKA